MKVVGILLGICVGVGIYTFIYARGASYLTDNPEACANCHVMQSHYDAWLKSSHRAVATCNSCHTPPGFFGKYMTKALNGFHHSLAMTTGRFHEPIQIGERNRHITELACRGCHQDIVQMIEGSHVGTSDLSCIRCHSTVGHPLGK